MEINQGYSVLCLLKSSLEFIYGTMLALFLLFYVAYVPQNSYKDDSTCIYTSQQALSIPSLVDRIIALDQPTNMVK